MVLKKHYKKLFLVKFKLHIWKHKKHALTLLSAIGLFVLKRVKITQYFRFLIGDSGPKGSPGLSCKYFTLKHLHQF